MFSGRFFQERTPLADFGPPGALCPTWCRIFFGDPEMVGFPSGFPYARSDQLGKRNHTCTSRCHAFCDGGKVILFTFSPTLSTLQPWDLVSNSTCAYGIFQPPGLHLRDSRALGDLLVLASQTEAIRRAELTRGEAPDASACCATPFASHGTSDLPDGSVRTWASIWLRMVVLFPGWFYRESITTGNYFYFFQVT